MIKVHKRKAWEFYLLLVPHREALASPNPSETSNAEAHADRYLCHKLWTTTGLFTILWLNLHEKFFCFTFYLIVFFNIHDDE